MPKAAPPASPGPSAIAVAWLHTGHEYEVAALVSAAVHIVITAAVVRFAKTSWVTDKLRKKEGETLAAMLFAAYAVGFVHAIVTSAAALRVVLYEDYSVWPMTLAYSLGYFVSDFIFYAAPTKQAAIIIHHLVMIVGHYPVMENEAAHLYGGGDAKLIMWLSAAGYLTEISNLFLDIRWFQLKVMPAAPDQTVYVTNSVFLLASYIVTRIVVMPWATLTHLWPNYNAYVEHHQVKAFWMIFGGACFITLMSVAYTYILLKPGIRAFLFYGKPGAAKGTSNGKKAE